MHKITLANDKGKTTACLYIKEDGNLHRDSWMCEKGWFVDVDMPINDTNVVWKRL